MTIEDSWGGKVYRDTASDIFIEILLAIIDRATLFFLGGK